MKTTIVCGVLGAGKTTFLGNILRKPHKNSLVLVNDFGSAGIDGEILSSGGIETIELPSGCVCCSLRFDLITTLQKIVQQIRPDHLYIEPSGIAAPSAVAEALEDADIYDYSIVGIVDASEFTEAYNTEMYGWFFKNQLTRSDLVVVNKIDLVDSDQVAKIMKTIEGINQNAVVIPAEHAAIDTALLAGLSGSRRKPVETEVKDIHVDTITITPGAGIGKEAMENAFSELASGRAGNVMSAKALITTDRGNYRFDLASGRISCKEFAADIKSGRLVIIGKELSEDIIRGLLQT